LEGTPKGVIQGARPALILFPRFGQAPAIRAVGAAEVFMRLTQASTNYVTLGRRGFDALNRLISSVPALAIDYPDTDTAVSLVEDFRQELAA
jgi:hypothetical protein